MVEVFKTNVKTQSHADVLLNHILEVYVNYLVNFDLDDCDKILRVESATEPIQATSIISLLKSHGVYSEVLPDEQLCLTLTPIYAINKAS